MRIKTFFLLVILLWGFTKAQSQNTELTIHLKNVSLGNVFELIQQQSEYIIFYKDSQVDLTRIVTIEADNLSIDQILKQALEDTGLKFKIFDRQIIIVQDKENLEQLNSIPLKGNVQMTRKLQGTVTDEDGNPLVGVSVLVKGTTIGITTNIDGFYSIDIPVDATILVFSFVGMKTIEEKLNDRSNLNITLVSENFGVEEVIISALGLKKSEKALTYATQAINAEDFATNREFSFVNSLSGKISGMDISRSAAGAGGSSKIILRGNKSLNTSSEPLFVIDGILMANNKGGQLGLFGGIDQGDGLSQISTDDIESINVLKGANAAALYGSQGANGVILITTKKGKEGSLSVSYSSSVTFESIQQTPKMQFEYGSVGGSKESWSYTKGHYASDFVKDFFQTGTNLVNTITMEGGKANTLVYFSTSNTSISGVIPNNRYTKTNLTFKQSTKLLNEKVHVESNIMLTDEITRNKNVAGYYYNPLTGLYLFPRDRDYASYAENYQVFDTARNMYLQNWFVNDHFQSNPMWIINNQRREDITKRLIGSMGIEYEVTQKLKLQLRGNYDYAVRSFEQKNKAGSNATNVHPNGSWSYEKIADELIYGDAILTYNHRFKNFSFNAVLGTSYQKSTYGLGITVNTDTNGLIYPNEFNFQNIANNVQVQSILKSRLIKEAVFGNLQIGYKEKIYIDLSGRNDWASSLYGTGNDSYFYPSVGITTLVSELFGLPDFIKFGKIRSSYAVVSNEVPFNSVSPNHTITTTGVNLNTTKPFTNLKPERIQSFEIGTNWRLFNRFGFDFTYYHVISRDQFISLPAPSGSGYTHYYVNAGKIVNSGAELSFNADLIKSKTFEWSSIINFAENKNTIVTLHPDLKNPIILSDNEGYQLIIKEGGSFGDIYVHKFLRDDQGNIKLDANGNIPKTEQKEYIGNSNPNWSLGFNNKLQYKNVTLTFLLNGKFGGKAISQTQAMLDGYGVSKNTAEARENGGIEINAVMPGGTHITTMDAKKYYTTIGDRDGIKEPYTYSRTNIRLAQINLSYQWCIPNSFIKEVNISLVGQNLFFIYKDAPFDPEITLNTKVQDQAIDNFSLPSTRIIGFHLKFHF